MEAVGGGVFDEVMRGFLVVALAMEGVDTIFVVGVAAPTWGFVLELRDGQDEFAAEGEGEDVISQAVASVAAGHGDEREGGVLAQDT